MATIRFYAKKYKENITIMAMLTHIDQHPVLSLGCDLPASMIWGKYKYWDDNKQVAKAHNYANEINITIADWQTKFKTYVKMCKDENAVPDMLFIKNILQNKLPVITLDAVGYLQEAAQRFIA